MIINPLILVIVFLCHYNVLLFMNLCYSASVTICAKRIGECYPTDDACSAQGHQNELDTPFSCLYFMHYILRRSFR